MEGVGGQRQGGGSTAVEPVRVETRRRLKIQRWFSNQASRSRERQWRRSLQWIRTLHWDLAMYGPFIPAEIQLEGIQEALECHNYTQSRQLSSLENSFENVSL